MAEAVIVSTARSPIGRALKGWLPEMRPDDLTVQMVQAALAKVPGLDVREIDDLLLGTGSPAGEAGYNIGRAVSVLAGMDHLPGVTVNRYCSEQPADHTHGHARDSRGRGRRLHLRWRRDREPLPHG